MNFDRLVQEFSSIGIKKGDVLALHSSLSSLGHVEGGALTVIRALQEIITEKGALIMPTHTSSLSCNDNGPFHPKKSGCKKHTGVIPDTFWRMEGVKRSLHPTHSAAAWGVKADWLIEHHSPFIYAFEENTPFHKAALMGGKILLLGVKNTRNSSIHVVEHLADAPYLEASYPLPEGTVYLTEQDDGSVREYPLTRYIPGCSKNFDIFDPLLLEKNIMKKCSIGPSESYLIDSYRMMKTLIPCFKKYPVLALCRHEDCKCCANRRKLFFKD
jgi:aminoglycoside 3-N-acetyltransferase